MIADSIESATEVADSQSLVLYITINPEGERLTYAKSNRRPPKNKGVYRFGGHQTGDRSAWTVAGSILFH